PLLQVLLTLQNLPFQAYPCGDLTIHPEPIFTGTTQFDLVLNLGDSDDGLNGWLEYNADIFTAETIQRLVEHLTEILIHCVTTPDDSVSAIPLLTAQERQLMQEWNNTLADYPRNQTAHQLVEAQVEKTPDAIALILGIEQLSYRALNQRANQLAHTLQQKGVGLETLVGVCVSRSMDRVIAVLAILKAGGAYVPLDPKYPRERLQFMLTDSQVGVLLTQTHLLESLPDTDADVICLDRELTGQSQSSPNPVDVTADNLAYVIYTSGSTGKPKGVLSTHGGLCNLTAVQQRCFKAGVGSRVLQFSSPSFDASIWAILMALTSGATLVLATSTDLIPGENLEQTLITYKISHVLLPPSVLPFLRAERLSVKHMIVGGEACSLELAHQWSDHCQFWNAYGPTEATVCSTLAQLDRQSRQLTIGRPLSNVHTYILDSKLQPVPIGVPGELHIGSVGLARGYLNRPELTEQKFIPNPFGSGRLYRTGDRARYLANGDIEFLGRIDFQIKLRGFRIELGEIEAVLSRQQSVKNCVVVARGDGQSQLIAYVVGDQDLAVDEIRRQLKQELPDYMVPGWIVPLETLPLTPNGKVDRKTLPEVDSSIISGQAPYVKPNNTIEETLVSIWESVLHVENVGINNNFFDLGGNSLLLVQAHAALQEKLQIKIPIVELFGYPTIKELSDFLTHYTQTKTATTRDRKRSRTRPDTAQRSDIAIVAMTGRFPGAKNVEQFWQNLKNGVESVSFFSDDELLKAGVEPALLQNPDYVKANPILDDIDLFDADFFDISPKEAEILDPQQRLFLECAWETLEQAGYDPQRYTGAIGVYAGLGINGYLLNNLIHRRDLLASLGNYRMVLASDKDFLPTRVAYKLNLTGAAINVQTACSTSLVAVHLACQSLINGETDMVLAGGASIRIPHTSGYLYQEGMILSPDGHCRAFDANAGGTIGGSGVAVVMLKRLEDAISDGDHCYAVIKGSAINNDGSRKVGYTAPAIDGQAAVIKEALAVANVEPESVGYIETHGTGTPLGDPIEIAALNRTFQQNPAQQQSCAIGSLKTNVGHLDAAAGVASLIKATLSLNHQLLPPSLNFESANPKTGLETSPFYVNTALKDWPQTDQPRRAGVSSFGIGGTNAHVILEEASQRSPSSPGRPWQPLLLSAKTASALDTATVNLVEHLRQQTTINLADVAYTLSCGRQEFAHRRVVVCQDRDQAIDALSDPSQYLTEAGTDSRSVAFLFPGQGAQHVNMGLDLYQSEPVFRQQVDYCAEQLQPLLDMDLRQLLYPQPDAQITAAEQLKQTAIAQPALFVIEYALAHLWLSWGVKPRAMLGHSIGEYVAACLAGVFSLEDGLALVVARGQLMQQLPRGAMLSVALPLKQLEKLLSEDESFGEIAIAVLNEPNRCVVSGPTKAIETLEHHLTNQAIESRRLQTSHAFHSPMMAPILEPFRQRCQQVNLQPPQIPYVSNLTGTWITTAQATDPDYWVQHLRQPVRFAQGVTQLCQDAADKQILLEVGPGKTLSSLT
ncbi:MAG: amino acid adenylation domain-containing protein, partial [Cyanobacteria bacterium P01_C01_bin.118]